MSSTTVELAQALVRIGRRPAEFGSANFSAAQSALASMGVELAEAVLREHGELELPLADAPGGFCWQQRGHEGACGNTGVQLVSAEDACGEVFGPLIRDDHSASRRVDVLEAEAPHLLAREGGGRDA